MDPLRPLTSGGRLEAAAADTITTDNEVIELLNFPNDVKELSFPKQDDPTGAFHLAKIHQESVPENGGNVAGGVIGAAVPIQYIPVRGIDTLMDSIMEKHGQVLKIVTEVKVGYKHRLLFSCKYVYIYFFFKGDISYIVALCV